MICISIDDREIQTKPDRTVLEVARENGIHIPTLCFHAALEPFASCRLCIVEVNSGQGWRLVASCAFPCTDGLAIRTNSNVVLNSRRIAVELLMASAAHIPLIQQLAEEYGVSEPRFTMEKNDCILCGLCVRACNELVRVGAISVINRGIDKKVSTPYQIASNVCIECGTCVLICPTGAIKLADITGGEKTAHKWESDFEKGKCQICGDHYQVPSSTDQVTFLTTPETQQTESDIEVLK